MANNASETVLTNATRLMAAHADRLAVAVAMVITVLSFLPRTTATGVPVNDLVNHFVAYCVLASLALYRRTTFKNGMTVFAMVVALGGIIEVIQPYFGRAGELNDFAANGLGALIGAILVLVLRRLGL